MPLCDKRVCLDITRAAPLLRIVITQSATVCAVLDFARPVMIGDHVIVTFGAID